MKFNYYSAQKDGYNPENEIRDVIEILEKRGISINIEGWYNKSKYATFFENNKQLFVIRFSDHSLNSGNYIPAGVIHDVWGENLESFTIEDFDHYYSVYENMSEEEKTELWTNRYI